MYSSLLTFRSITPRRGCAGHNGSLRTIFANPGEQGGRPPGGISLTPRNRKSHVEGVKAPAWRLRCRGTASPRGCSGAPARAGFRVCLQELLQIGRIFRLRSVHGAYNRPAHGRLGQCLSNLTARRSLCPVLESGDHWPTTLFSSGAAGFAGVLRGRGGGKDQQPSRCSNHAPHRARFPHAVLLFQAPVQRPAPRRAFGAPPRIAVAHCTAVPSPHGSASPADGNPRVMDPA